MGSATPAPPTADSSDTRLLPADAGGIAAAIALLLAGEVVALPTETVYGLGADAENGSAVARIYAAKGRPQFNPLIVHVTDSDMAARYACLPPLAQRAAERFWPGPLTLVAPLQPAAPLSSLVAAGLPTVALRAPAHPAMRAVLAGLGRGVAAPSANRSGYLSPTRAAHVLASLGGRIPLVLDGGPCAAGIESTILRAEGAGFRLLRPGALSSEEIEAALNVPVLPLPRNSAVAAPGMTIHHYAPRLPVRLRARTARPGEFLLGFGAVGGDASLSASGDPVEAAARLFDLLFTAERSGATAIAIAPIPNRGLGLAINDRLRRAAASAPRHKDGNS